MNADLVLRGARLPDRESPVDIVIADGRIAAIGVADRAARETIDLAGRLVTPGLVEAHIHLDKAFLTERVSATAGTLEEAIRLTGEIKRGFTVDDVRARARRVLDLAVRAGTTAMRAHVEVDPIVGLTGMEAVSPLREEYAPALDLQICAFAQEGILKSPGTEGLLRRVFGLAEAFGVDADFHADFADEPEHLHVRAIIAETLRAGWQGRVVVGHLTELAALPAYAGDDANVRRGLAPIARLLAAGVPVALASNNILNPFTPVGTADLAHLGYVTAVAAHMGTPAHLRALLSTITTHPAAMLRLPDYGLAPGCAADLVVWECERPEEVVATLPGRALVVKRGRATVQFERRVVERWRAR